MLLTETIKNSTSAILKKRNIQEREKSAESYSKALLQLAKESAALKDTLDCAVEMKATGIVEQPLIMQQTRDDLVEYVNTCGNGVFEGSLTSDMVTALRAKNETVAGQLRIIWKSASVEYSRGTSGYLSIIGGLTDDPRHAKALADNIAQTTAELLSISSIKKLVAYVSEAQKITKAFSLNTEIEEFLTKVSSQEATIADLTPNVLTWLRDHNLSDRLKIRF